MDAVGAVCLRGDEFRFESVVSGVEARHKRFETWNNAGRRRDVKCSWRPYAEVRQGQCWIGGEVVARKAD